MLTEEEKRLLLQAENQAKSMCRGGLEKYLNPEIREQVQQDPGRTAWAIHFYEELRQSSESSPVFDPELLAEAYVLADAAVAYERFGLEAFNQASYLADRKLSEEFTQLLQRYRLRLSDPSIKTVLFRLAQEVCAA